MGFFGISYPEAYGGLDLFYTVIFLEELQKNKNLVLLLQWAHAYLAMTHLNAEGDENQTRLFSSSMI
jgi:alkylation response protein AidB-like acyl-CoA dehydrogenase